MITDDDIKKAAEAYANAYMAAIDKEFADAPPHQFSPEFERKIEKLTRKLEHPILFRLSRPLYRAAAVIIVLFLSSGVWLSIDAHAREAIFGWIKNTVEHYFVYNYEGDNADTANNGITHYELTWIPEGYRELGEDNLANMLTKTYANEEGMVLVLQRARCPRS